jgi:hypothetical protein
MLPTGSSIQLLLNVYRFESVIFYSLERPPWYASVDYLGFAGSADSLGRGIVAAISHATHQKLDACLDKTFGRVD